MADAAKYNQYKALENEREIAEREYWSDLKRSCVAFRGIDYTEKDIRHYNLNLRSERVVIARHEPGRHRPGAKETST